MNRKRSSLVVLIAVLVFGMMAVAQDDITQSPSCKYCGMDRNKFGFSRMMINYEDGTSVGVCSLHCAAVELATNIDKTPKAVLVADFGTRELTDAETAVWVVGGSKPGVMSKRGKWAFGKQADAESFVKTNGGAVASFDEAIKASYTDMYEDTMMIRQKRKMKKAHAM